MKQRNQRGVKSLKATKRKRLEAGGWKVGSTQEFLGLSEEEVAFVELKLTLSASLKACRTSQGLSQSESAKRLRSSQSRVAKIGASDPDVATDLRLETLLLRLGSGLRSLVSRIAALTP
jgi:hypothetical protein